MPTGFEIFAKIIPDTKELDKLKREGINIKAKTTGVAGETSPQISTLNKNLAGLTSKFSGVFGVGGGLVNKVTGGLGAAEGVGGTAGMAGAAGIGVFAAMGAIEILKRIGKFVMSLEPMQETMKVIQTIMKLFFLPLSIMLMRLVMPLLIPFLKMMPYWIKFWSSPQKYLGAALEKINDFFSTKLPVYINQAVEYFSLNVGKFIDLLVKVFPVLFAGFNLALGSFLMTMAAKFNEWVIGKITDFISGGLGKLSDWVTDGLGSLADWVSGGLGKLSDWILNIKFSIWDFIETPVKSIWDFITTETKSIGETTEGILSWLNPFDDFVITKSGQVLRTSPDDYIFGTKNPQTMGGKNIENNIYVNVAGVLDDAMVQEIAYRIRQEVNRAIGVV